MFNIFTLEISEYESKNNDYNLSIININKREDKKLIGSKILVRYILC